MDAALKYKLVEKIIQSDDDALLDQVKQVLGIKDTDYWRELPPALKTEIHTAKSELDKGMGIPHSQAVAEIAAFLK